MSDLEPGTTPAAEEPRHAESVVRHTGHQRQRVTLGILLVVLFLLLVGAGYAVLRLSQDKGDPQGESELPQGVNWIRSIDGWGSRSDQSLRAPTDVAIARDGTIWVVSGHNTVAGFNPDGSPKKVIRPRNTTSIEAVAVGDNGNVFVTDFGGQVLELDPASGNTVNQWKVELPQEIDVDGDKIAVSTSAGIAVIAQSDSKVILQIGGERGGGEGQFDLPHGIAIADDGKIYVSDSQNRRVKAFSSTGRPLWTLGDAPDRSQPGGAAVRTQGDTMTAAPFMLPSGLTFDGKGRLVVVDPFKFRVAIVDPDTGKIVREEGEDGKPGRLAFYGEQGAGDGFFNYPTGIDYDARRDWFAVADTANNRVQIFRLPDTGGSLFAPLIGAFRLPMCIFCIPWILLLIALIVALARRRRERELTPEEAAELEAGVTMQAGDTAC